LEHSSTGELNFGKFCVAINVTLKRNFVYCSVFVHRYRDVEAVIRTECIRELGLWIIKYPDRFLDDIYLRYLGWQLSDKVSEENFQ
jgi:hypothetical protein